MVSFFRDKSAVAVFWLIIICFGLHIYSLVNPPQIITTADDGFFYYLLNPFKTADPYISSLLYVCIILLLALQLNFVLNILHMFSKPSYTPALAFILFSALLPAFNVITPALFACNFLIWILYQACKLYNASNPKTSIYNLGLLTGSCVILYYPSLPLIIIAMIALAIIRPFRINEWFVLIFGIVTPAYFLTAYLFLTDQFNLLPLPQKIFGLIKLPVQPLPITIGFITVALTTIWGIFSVQNAGNAVLIQVRKNWSVFLISFIFLVPVVFFITGANPLALLLAAVPAAAYTGFAFANNLNILSVIFFWAFVALDIYNNWFAKY